MSNLSKVMQHDIWECLHGAQLWRWRSYCWQGGAATLTMDDSVGADYMGLRLMLLKSELTF